MATHVHYSPLAKLTLKGSVPSKKNSKRRIQRGRNVFMVPSEAHEAWHGTAIHEAIKQWAGKPTLTETRQVVLNFYGADRRKADLSNKAESVMDLLVDAGILLDDNWFVVPCLVLLFACVDKDDPRVVIDLY